VSRRAARSSPCSQWKMRSPSDGNASSRERLRFIALVRMHPVALFPDFGKLDLRPGIGCDELRRPNFAPFRQLRTSDIAAPASLREIGSSSVTSVRLPSLQFGTCAFHTD